MSSSVEQRGLRELYGLVPKINPFVQTRWASLYKTSRDIVNAWDALREAAATELSERRASHDAVREIIDVDLLLLSKIVFLREFARKMLSHIEWFESDKVRGHEVYQRLVAIQNGFSPLFDAEEVGYILQEGRCPEALAAAMRELVTVASHAAANAWRQKMITNQDAETIEFFQMLAFFDPKQRDAYLFTADQILSVIRPVHNSIFPRIDDAAPVAPAGAAAAAPGVPGAAAAAVAAAYDPLKVLPLFLDCVDPLGGSASLPGCVD